MLSTLFLLLIIGLSVAVGCYVGQKHLVEMGEYQPLFSKEYFTGLNYLLNEQPDKAVELFTKLLQVDSDTVETHLALGSLFRKRGEIGRAIKIHQNLIARPKLPKQQRMAALVALGKDYLQAGLVDRAEKLFLEITSLGDDPEISLQYLLSIYQQQKNWESAIKAAKQLKAISSPLLSIEIAHYYCELAQTKLVQHDTDSAMKLLKLALKQDPECVRATLLISKLYFEQAEYKQAIKSVQTILKQDKVLFSEGLKFFYLSYQKLMQESQCVELLKDEFHAVSNIDVALYITDYYKQQEGEDNFQNAFQYLSHYLQRFPSLKGLIHLIDLKTNYENKNYDILRNIIETMIKTLSRYRCIQCGFKTNQLIWLCPGCKEWSTIKPVSL
jgi:lipopolysaccharide biosynthesis regulator YciM